MARGVPGQKRKPQWDELIDKLSPLAYLVVYTMASEDATEYL
jgi:hypothetical protein